MPGSYVTHLVSRGLARMRDRRRRGTVLAMVFGIAFTPGGFAQERHAFHEIPVVPAALLERPVPLRSGIGVTHDAVTTSSPEAQKFYDQGLEYVHDYIWIEAARSFNQALRLDPNLALAYVGLSSAYTGMNQSAATRRALQRAATLAPRAAEHDRVHVAIRQRQLEAEDAPQDATKLAAYRKALDEALADFPADVELWLQRGVAESPDPADRGQGSVPSSIPYYERALTLVPDHFAAHHYLTHAYENSGRVQEALRHGAAYASQAPDVPHARHMYGHDLRRVGRIGEAIAEFEAADRLESAYFKAEDMSPEYDWHYEHNLDLLAMSYQYVGQVAKAEPLLKAAFDLPTGNLVQAFNKREWPLFLRSRGRGDEAMAAAAALITHPHAVVQAIGHIEMGHLQLLKGRFAEAAAEANAALPVVKSGAGGSGLLALPFEALQGEFFLRTGQRDKGRTMLEAMIKKARTAAGPDEWSQALFTLEAIARTARETGEWALARRVAREMLDHDPAYAGTHYAIALAAEQQGDRPAARAEFALAEQYWSNADRDLMELQDIRRRTR
jgi:tetratricopeptide (TPR) repeat protein